MMKYKNVLYTAVISTLCLGITSCSDFLDEMPDNRTELTTEESITKVLVSAYPMTTNCHIGEFYSDNIDENSKAYSYLFRLNEHLYRWQQTTEEFAYMTVGGHWVCRYQYFGNAIFGS